MFSTNDFSPISEMLTLSTYQINNIQLYTFDEVIYLIVALASGQVSLYKEINSNFQITQN